MEEIKLPIELKSSPIVFAVGHEYHIMALTRADVIFRVTVNGKHYYDADNGLMRSNTPVHKVVVPMAELDAAKEYTVSYRRVIQRPNILLDPESVTIPFRPVPTDRPINIYHISDSHGRIKHSIKGAQDRYGDDLDLLILNGDIPTDNMNEYGNIMLVHELAAAITGGQRTVIHSRGNHDTRGHYAEHLSEFVPTANGKFYYTVRVGNIWAMILDCGEDKADNHEAYGGDFGINVGHEFRLEQTQFIKDVIANAKNEYLADGVKYRFIIVHNPFTMKHGGIFDIENEIYDEWSKLVGENIKPQLHIVGHIHRAQVYEVGGPLDTRGQTCPVIAGGVPFKQESGRGQLSASITLDGYSARVEFNDNFEIDRSDRNMTLELIK